MDKKTLKYRLALGFFTLSLILTGLGACKSVSEETEVRETDTSI